MQHSHKHLRLAEDAGRTPLKRRGRLGGLAPWVFAGLGALSAALFGFGAVVVLLLLIALLELLAGRAGR